MRALWTTALSAAVAGALACGGGTGPATSRNNPGTGTSTLKVTADIDANDDPTVIGGFSTDYSVSVRDGLGSKVSGATVTISNPSLGTITLLETGTGSGDYAITGNTFPSGDFTLNVVKGTDNVQNVVLGGPGVHTITAPAKNATVQSSQPLTVTWVLPSAAKSAEVKTKDYDAPDLPDNGTFVIPAGPVTNPPRPDQRIRVFRFNEITTVDGMRALPGSRLRVQVRQTVEPVIVQ